VEVTLRRIVIQCILLVETYLKLSLRDFREVSEAKENGNHPYYREKADLGCKLPIGVDNYIRFNGRRFLHGEIEAMGC
jgi:hypothetical protein